jgi:hypothetical protein
MRCRLRIERNGDRFIGEFKAKSLFIELFCTGEIFEIEFDASQPQFRFLDFLRDFFLAGISKEYSSGWPK